MTKGKLYGSANNFRTQKVLAAAQIAKVEVTLVGDKPPHDKFPLGVTPAFEEGNTLLFGAESIALHLLGKNFDGKHLSEIVQWLQFAEGSLLPAVLGFVLPNISAAQIDNKVVGEFKNELLALLKALNQVLLTKTYLVGERLSIADVSVALDLLPAYQHVLDASLRSNFQNVNRWFLTVLNQPAVKKVVGDFAFISKASTFNAATFKELSAKYQTSSAPAKTEAKKEKKEAAHDDEGDAADDAVAQEPKSVDPFAAMPKGTFVFDNFKRVYSNEETSVSLPYFWDNFDAEANSIWYCEYKYPTELKACFMSCNLIGGMFQRLEKLNKYAFASMCLFGTDNNSTISGVWVWRGHELAFPLSPDWQIDYESYDWKKLDPKDPKTKKLVNEYFAWEGDFDGKKFNQGKIFK